MDSIIANVNTGQDINVYWQDEVELQLDLNLMYIKSGQEEIQDYVDNVSKPEIDNYIETEAKPIVSEVVTQIAEPVVNEYLETVTKPAIDEYFNEKKPEVENLVNQAQVFANDSQTSAEASAASAAVAETALTTLTTTATDNFNANASEKQAQIDASANAAANYANNASADAVNAAESAGLAANSAAAAKVSETNAKTSETSAAATKEEVEAIAELASFGNIGDIKYTSRTDVPNGGAWCDGALYTKAQFPGVYQMLVNGKIQSTTITDFDSKVSANGSCGLFGLDTSNKRFKVPMLKDVYLKAGQAGSMFGAESLPNIRGEGSMRAWSVDGGSIFLNPTGAFYNKASGSKMSAVAPGDSNKTSTVVAMDASRSSSTYQDGAKVNPDHVVYRAYVVLYATAAEASVAQAAEFMTALGGKANVDLSNISENIDYVIFSGKKNGVEIVEWKSGKIELFAYVDNVSTSGTLFPLPYPRNSSKSFTCIAGGVPGASNNGVTSFYSYFSDDSNIKVVRGYYDTSSVISCYIYAWFYKQQ